MNQSVIKALKLLDFFTEDTRELSLKEITRKANLPKPTVYRLLSSLEQSGFLMKVNENEQDTKYRLGLKLLELGNLVSEQLEIRTIAKPYMEALANDINEAVHLVILHDYQAIYIEKVDSNRALRLYTNVGKSSPLYIGSGPKLLLAFLNDQKQNEIVSHEPLYPLMDDRPINKQKLLQELKEIREKGYSISIGEQDIDTTGVSYPVYDYQKKVAAALTVSGLSSHFEGENLEYIKQKTKKAAQDISAALGYLPL